MPDEVINGKLEVNGQADATQVTVKGHSSQSDPLQAWQDNQGNTLAQVSSDGRLQTGDLTLGVPSAMVEANADLTPSDSPQRGIQSLGRITGALSGAINWAVHELELLGTGGVSSLQTAVRGILTIGNSGNNSLAEGRAADFEAINQAGTSGTPTGKLIGVRSAVTNQDTAHIDEAIGLQAEVVKGATGTLQKIVGVQVLDLPAAEVERFAIRTGDGPVHFGDYLELKEQAVVPAAPAASSGLVRVYPKVDGKLYAKDDTGAEYDLTGAGSGGSGTADDVLTWIGV